MSSRPNPFASPVPPDNPGGRGRRAPGQVGALTHRADPPAEPPPSSPPPPDPEPERAAEPTALAPDPVPAPRATSPRRAQPPARRERPNRTLAAAPEPRTLASRLGADQHDHRPPPDEDERREETYASPTLSLQDLMRMRRRPVNPMQDWEPDGTRQLAWIQDAVRTLTGLTSRSSQEIIRDALLGIEPIPEEILDAAFYARYGYERPRGD